VVITDESVDVSQLFGGHVPGLPLTPQVYAYLQWGQFNMFLSIWCSLLHCRGPKCVAKLLEGALDLPLPMFINHS